MKYEAEIGGQKATLEIEERDGRVIASVEGRSYELEVVRPEEGVYLLFNGEAVHEARVSLSEGGDLQVRLRGRTYNVSLIDRKSRRHSEDYSDNSRKQLIAPMPGKVVKVLLNAGDEVASGQGVIIVEAMKMQNEVKSPKAGRVLEIRATEGDAVSANQILAIVE